MNKLLLIIFLVSINISAQKIDRSTYYKYSDNVEFRIFTIYKNKMINQGTNNYANIVKAKKGNTFITIVFEFKNNSSEPQEIDFDNIYLRGENGDLHKADFVVMSMKVTTTGKIFQKKINGNKQRKIIARFTPSFPKDEVIDDIIIGDTEIKLNYN